MSDQPFSQPLQTELDQPESSGGNVVHAGSEHSSAPRMIAEDQEPVSRFTDVVGRL